jgi:hypothetical protein
MQKVMYLPPYAPDLNRIEKCWTFEYSFMTQGNLWNSHLDGTASFGESIIVLDIGAIEPRKSAKTKPP